MTKLTRTSPSNQLRTLQREVDQLFDSFFGQDRDEETNAVWAPQMDMMESDDAYRIQLDVPGLSKEDLTINYQDNRLTVQGTRTAEEQHEGTNYVRTERTFGNFYRSFTLPKSIKAEDIEASYDNGVLTIDIPKTEQSTTRQIEIH